MRVYEKVRQYINENHLKQASIAKALGLRSSTFSDMLRGKRKMNAEDLRALCLTLKVSADRFIDTGDSAHH